MSENNVCGVKTVRSAAGGEKSENKSKTRVRSFCSMSKTRPVEPCSLVKHPRANTQHLEDWIYKYSAVICDLVSSAKRLRKLAGGNNVEVAENNKQTQTLARTADPRPVQKKEDKCAAAQCSVGRCMSE